MNSKDLADAYVSAFNAGYKLGWEECEKELKTCRNELCLRCGNYKNSHKGACDGCRWQNGG